MKGSSQHNQDFQESESSYEKPVPSNSKPNFRFLEEFRKKQELEKNNEIEPRKAENKFQKAEMEFQKDQKINENEKIENKAETEKPVKTNKNIEPNQVTEEAPNESSLYDNSDQLLRRKNPHYSNIFGTPNAEASEKDKEKKNTLEVDSSFVDHSDFDLRSKNQNFSNVFNDPDSKKRFLENCSTRQPRVKTSQKEDSHSTRNQIRNNGRQENEQFEDKDGIRLNEEHDYVPSETTEMTVIQQGKYLKENEKSSDGRVGKGSENKGQEGNPSNLFYYLGMEKYKIDSFRDESLRSHFLRYGFHVISVSIDCDPLSGKSWFKRKWQF